MTVLEVLKLASDHFQKRGSDSARLDAEVLLAHTLGLRRLDLYLKFDRPLTDPEVTSYRELVAKRAKGEPVAYLVGHKEFMGLDFVVTPAVLVPNPDTEVLVQRAVAIARDAERPLRVADVVRQRRQCDERRSGRVAFARQRRVNERIANLFADLAYGVVDPRIRFSGRRGRRR